MAAEGKDNRSLSGGAIAAFVLGANWALPRVFPDMIYPEWFSLTVLIASLIGLVASIGMWLCAHFRDESPPISAEPKSPSELSDLNIVRSKIERNGPGTGGGMRFPEGMKVTLIDSEVSDNHGVGIEIFHRQEKDKKDG